MSNQDEWQESTVAKGVYSCQVSSETAAYSVTFNLNKLRPLLTTLRALCKVADAATEDAFFTLQVWNENVEIQLANPALDQECPFCLVRIEANTYGFCWRWCEYIHSDMTLETPDMSWGVLDLT